MRKFSLRYQLVLPFVLLTLLVPAGIGWMLYDSGTVAVSSLARRVLLDVVQQINTSTEQHLTTAITSLNSFAPEASDTPAAQSFSSDMSTLERRAWTTTQQVPQSGNYIYFGGADGRFVGLYRINSYLLELYLRRPGTQKRHIYALKQSSDRPALLRTDDYDPRVRPWYTAASAQDHPVWSPVYNDFTSGKPTITVARQVRNARKELIGVAAADIELKTLADRLMSLAISQNGIAFVMDNKGFIIASSDQTLLSPTRNGKSVLTHASDVNNALIRASHLAILAWKNGMKNAGESTTLEVETDDGVLNLAMAKVGTNQGVDWITAVVAPRSDFMASMTSSFNRSLLIAVICVFVSLLIGILILNRVLRDIYALNNAAQRIGLGESLPPLSINRRDELGQLARTFSEMEHNLRIDKLTGTFNREFLSNKIRQMHQSLSNEFLPHQNFALLFVDLDGFKSINDQFGHDAGDKVLIEIASRLKNATRATDFVVRYGGDEFVVLLNNTASEETVTVTEEKIRAVVELPITIDQHDILAGISIGWALFPQEGTNAETLLKIADARMFEAKKARKSAR